MGWRENAERLRERIKKSAYDGIATALPPEFFQFLDNMPEPGPGYMWTIGVSENTGLNAEFVEALNSSSKRNMTPLADYLKSDHPLGRTERDRLARFLPKATRKHAHSTQARAAANMAELFYKKLRELNRAQGIKDHGECGPMKEYAARTMSQDWFALSTFDHPVSEGEIDTFVNLVLSLMEKSKSRRDGAGRGLVSFPAFHPKYRPKP